MTVAPTTPVQFTTSLQDGTPVTDIPVTVTLLHANQPGEFSKDPVVYPSSGTTAPNWSRELMIGSLYSFKVQDGPAVNILILDQNPFDITAELLGSTGISPSYSPPGAMLKSSAFTTGNLVLFDAFGNAVDGAVRTAMVNGVTLLRHAPGISLYSSVGTQPIPGDATPTQINLGTLLYDDLEIFDEAFPNQFIIPPGVARMSILGKVNISQPLEIGANSSSLFAQILRSPSSPIVFVQPIPHLGQSSYLTNDPDWLGAQVCGVEITAMDIPVTPGDIWTLWAQQRTGVNQNCSSARFQAKFFA